jgi:hypothetical protein
LGEVVQARRIGFFEFLFPDSFHGPSPVSAAGLDQSIAGVQIFAVRTLVH